jgi:hypothetical protein
METNVLHIISAIFIIVICISPFLLLAAWFVVRWDKAVLDRELREEMDYMVRYNKLQNTVDSGTINEVQFMVDFNSLEHLSYKNPEKTEVLWNKYLMKREAIKEPELITQ